MTTYAEPAVIEAGTTDDGITVAEITPHLSDARHRLPAALALAQATGGVYAESVAGMTLERALAAAELDFTVVKAGPLSAPITTRSSPDDGPVSVNVTGLDRMRATVATWPGGKTKPRMLGVVGKDYPVAQPRQAGEFGQILLDEGGATVAAVCAYGDPRGSRMLLALKLPEQITVGGVDPHDVYLYVGNSFNRETSLWGCVAPIRLDCVNQAAATFGRLANRFTIPHRGDMDSKVADAREALKISGTFTERFKVFAEKLLTAPMEGSEVDEFLAELLPTPGSVKTGRGEDNWYARRGAIAHTIHRGDHNTVGRGTRWAAYNGVVEWIDHSMKATSPLKRATRLVDGGQTERVKVSAARLLLAGL